MFPINLPQQELFTTLTQCYGDLSQIRERYIETTYFVLGLIQVTTRKLLEIETLYKSINWHKVQFLQRSPGEQKVTAVTIVCYFDDNKIYTL